MTGLPPRIISGANSLVQAASLMALAYLLRVLQASGTLLYLGAGIGTGQLIVAALVAAWCFFLGASWTLVPWFSGLFRHVFLRRAAGFLGGIITCAWLLLLAGYGFLTLFFSGPGYQRISAPAGEHTLLINNQSILLIGSHAVYEQVQGPVYAYRDQVLTDDGYDPFSGGAFSVQWGEKTATISFAVYSQGEDGNAGDRSGRAVIPLRAR